MRNRKHLAYNANKVVVGNQSEQDKWAGTKGKKKPTYADVSLAASHSHLPPSRADHGRFKIDELTIDRMVYSLLV